MNEDEIIKSIKEELSDALEGVGADLSCVIDNLDLENNKVTITFDINVVPEDKYAGFAYY